MCQYDWMLHLHFTEPIWHSRRVMTTEMKCKTLCGKKLVKGSKQNRLYNSLYTTCVYDVVEHLMHRLQQYMLFN